VKAYRPSQWAIAYEEWKDSAACIGKPPEWFELAESRRLDLQVEHERIAKGLKVCTSCPVRQECKSNSSDLDRHWTTRGGQPPEGLFPDSKRPDAIPAKPLKGLVKIARKPKEKCKRGHIDWVLRADGKRRCKVCRKADNQRAEEKRKQNTLKGLRERGVLTVDPLLPR
jgi:hypothetical protein